MDRKFKNKVSKGNILAISKNEKECIFTIQKDSNLAENIYFSLVELGFDETKSEMKNLFTSKKWNTKNEGNRFKDVMNFEDYHTLISNKTYNISIFVGKGKAFLVIQGKDKQKEISESIDKFFDFKD